MYPPLSRAVPVCGSSTDTISTPGSNDRKPKEVRAMSKPIVISIVNQKGGVGKTTTTASLGAGLARKGYRVLLVDLDSQCNLSQSLVDVLTAEDRCVANCILEETSLDSVIKPTETEGLFIAPAGEDMTGIDSEPRRSVVSRVCVEEVPR